MPIQLTEHPHHLHKKVDMQIYVEDNITTIWYLMYDLFGLTQIVYMDC